MRKVLLICLSVLLVIFLVVSLFRSRMLENDIDNLFHVLIEFREYRTGTTLWTVECNTDTLATLHQAQLLLAPAILTLEKSSDTLLTIESKDSEIDLRIIPGKIIAREENPSYVITLSTNSSQ